MAIGCAWQAAPANRINNFQSKRPVTGSNMKASSGVTCRRIEDFAALPTG
jgi:hypothetical protein